MEEYEKSSSDSDQTQHNIRRRQGLNRILSRKSKNSNYFATVDTEINNLSNNLGLTLHNDADNNDDTKESLRKRLRHRHTLDGAASSNTTSQLIPRIQIKDKNTIKILENYCPENDTTIIGRTRTSDVNLHTQLEGKSVRYWFETQTKQQDEQDTGASNFKTSLFRPLFTVIDAGEDEKELELDISEHLEQILKLHRKHELLEKRIKSRDRDRIMHALYTERLQQERDEKFSLESNDNEITLVPVTIQSHPHVVHLYYSSIIYPDPSRKSKDIVREHGINGIFWDGYAAMFKMWYTGPMPQMITASENRIKIKFKAKKEEKELVCESVKPKGNSKKAVEEEKAVKNRTRRVKKYLDAVENQEIDPIDSHLELPLTWNNQVETRKAGEEIMTRSRQASATQINTQMNTQMNTQVNTQVQVQVQAQGKVALVKKRGRPRFQKKESSVNLDGNRVEIFIEEKESAYHYLSSISSSDQDSDQEEKDSTFSGGSRYSRRRKLGKESDNTGAEEEGVAGSKSKRTSTLNTAFGVAIPTIQRMFLDYNDALWVVLNEKGIY